VTRNLTQDVKADVADALVPLGLRRRKLGFLTCDLNSECLGWIALGTASEGTPHARRVWPKVGVRHQEAERIVAILQGELPHQYLPPTITTGLGYTSPGNRWIEWPFAEGEDWSLQVAEIREAVAAYGLPWMRQRASVPSLLEAATSENLSLRAEYVVPVLLHLSQRHNEARQALDGHVAELGVRDDEAAIAYRRFAQAFVEFQEGSGE
jgi:hypothetical protein